MTTPRPDDSPSPLLAHRSPLGALHADATTLGTPAHPPEDMHVDHLYGPHGLKFPIMSLLVRRHLGPVRHALTQRTVAGGLKIVYAPGDRPAAPPSVVPANPPR